MKSKGDVKLRSIYRAFRKSLLIKGRRNPAPEGIDKK